MVEGADIYADMAQAIYKRPINKHDDPVERDIGKHSVLGLGYGMGKRKFQSAYAPDQTEEFCGDVVQVYRQDWAPEVRRFWYALHGASVNALVDRRPTETYGIEFRLEDAWLTERLPSGRKLWYFKPHLMREPMPWDDTDIRLTWFYEAEKQG